MKTARLHAIARRDALLFLRTSWYFLPLALLQVLVMQYTAMLGLFQIEIPLEVKQQIFAGLLAYVPIMVIPFMGNMVMNKTVLEDRLHQTLLRTLVTGIGSGQLWWVKFAFAALVSYGVMLLSIILTWLAGSIMIATPIAIDVTAWISIFIVNPALSLALLAIMAFLYRVFKRPAMIITFLPMLVMFGGWMLASSSPSNALFSPWMALLLLVSSSAVIVLAGWASTRLSRERIAGLY